MSWHKQQMEPQTYHRIKNYLTTNNFPSTFNSKQKQQLQSQSKFFEVKQNQLYKKDRRRKTRNQLLKVIQKNEIEPILYLMHNHSTGAHLGIDRTFDKIHNQYYCYKCLTTLKTTSNHVTDANEDENIEFLDLCTLFLLVNFFLK